jgi:hypothetical protein
LEHQFPTLQAREAAQANRILSTSNCEGVKILKDDMRHVQTETYSTMHTHEDTAQVTKIATCI